MASANEVILGATLACNVRPEHQAILLSIRFGHLDLLKSAPSYTLLSQLDNSVSSTGPVEENVRSLYPNKHEINYSCIA